CCRMIIEQRHAPRRWCGTGWMRGQRSRRCWGAGWADRGGGPRQALVSQALPSITAFWLARRAPFIVPADPPYASPPDTWSNRPVGEAEGDSSSWKRAMQERPGASARRLAALPPVSRPARYSPQPSEWLTDSWGAPATPFAPKMTRRRNARRGN